MHEVLPPDASTEETHPFVIERLRLDKTDGGYFRPAARVLLTPALRTSGLLAALRAEDLQSLLTLFTLVTPNGRCAPTVVELVDALHVPERDLRARMQRFGAFIWQDRPLVTELKRESGLDAFVPSPEIVAVREAMQAPEEPPAPMYRAAGKDAVIAYSRERYSKPRTEVEAEIARNMGWNEEPDTPLYRRLLALGLRCEQADSLLSRFALERIERQIEWLGLRSVRNPAAFLVAAIEGDYEPPPAVRLEQAVEQHYVEPVQRGGEAAAAVQADGEGDPGGSDTPAGDPVHEVEPPARDGEGEVILTLPERLSPGMPNGEET